MKQIAILITVGIKRLAQNKRINYSLNSNLKVLIYKFKIYFLLPFHGIELK
jgi:hypothetical protein